MSASFSLCLRPLNFATRIFHTTMNSQIVCDDVEGDVAYADVVRHGYLDDVVDKVAARTSTWRMTCHVMWQC